MTNKHIKSLYVFDIDDTLFQTTARVKVESSNGKIRYLSSYQLKDFELAAGEKMCFAEFRDARKFAEESKPIKPMVKIAQRCIKKTAIGFHLKRQTSNISKPAMSKTPIKKAFFDFVESVRLHLLTNHLNSLS